jgi:hypothetical protein
MEANVRTTSHKSTCTTEPRERARRGTVNVVRHDCSKIPQPNDGADPKSSQQVPARTGEYNNAVTRGRNGIGEFLTITTV